MRPLFRRSISEQVSVMSSPGDGLSGTARRSPPQRRDKRTASAERCAWDSPHAGGDGCGDGGSPLLTDSRASLHSNRDSGYVPSPFGAVRFDLDASADADADEPPAAPPPSVIPRRSATRPIAIPGRGAGLPSPQESDLLRRRRRERCERRERRGTYDFSSEDEDGASSSCAAEEDGEDGEDCDGEDAGTQEDGDVVDRAEEAREIALLRREAETLQVGWREGAVIPPRFTVRGELPDVVPARPALAASAPALHTGGVAAAGARVRRPGRTSRAASVSLTVELDVGQELREIADSLRLSRSAPGALLPRRDIWTLIRRTFDFGLGREVAARPRPAGGRP